MRKLFRNIAAVAVLGAAAAILPMAATGPAAASAPPAASFNQNLLLQGSDGAGEPSIRTDRFGQSFVIGPIGVPAGCKAFRVRHDGSGSTFLGFPDSTAGGGDCDLALGPQETNSAITPAPSDSVLAYSSLTLADITVGKSDDGGNSFGPPNVLGSQIAVDDRMWQAADPKLNGAGYDDMFMTYHDIDTDNIQLVVSTDGGQTYAQSGPIINPQDVPYDQVLATCPAAGCIVGGPAVGTGNELGNIVARRDAFGQLTLYSIFTTAENAADNTAGVNEQNRVYEAVGTVTDAPGTGTPALISWRNYEIWHGPLGARYDRIFPVTDVDSAGRVYAIFTDGKNILSKTDATGTGWNPSVAPSVITNPGGVNTTVFPWIAAGKGGIADVVFYGASANTAGNNLDPSAQWNVYLAQTVDGGSTWTVNQASDHTIHTGVVCTGGTSCSTQDRILLDFFQVSIDPTNGAADITYTDDHAAPRTSSVLYFTRQCTGVSATTGLALTNDCKAPPPPPPPPTLPPGTPCPGPQVADFTNDAPDNYIGGDGSNIDGLDIENVTYSTDTSGDLKITLTAKNLSVPPPPANITGSYWAVYFTYNSTQYIVQASGSGNAATVMYTAGPNTTDNQAEAEFNNTPITGSFNPGPNGTIVFTVPRSLVGNPPDGATLTNLFADTHSAVVPPVAAGGVYYTAATDRAPDTNFSDDASGNPVTYTVGQTCSGGGGGGATPAQLALAPKTETDTVGTQASETATVTDSSNNPVPNVVVRFTVTGPNAGTFTQTTDQFGQAKITYTGGNTGTDNISVYADTDNSNTQNSGEPGDTATKTWNATVPTPCTVKITTGGWITADDANKSNFSGNAQATTNGSLSGQEKFQDSGANVNMQSINVSSVTCPSATQAQIFGTATINGSGSYTYTITVQDGASTNQPDMYGIELSNGYSSGEHSLGGGSIDIHRN